MPEPQSILCPYCGEIQRSPADRCGACGGFFDPLSRKVTQQHMGPWFIRDSRAPFRPGCSYDVIAKQIERGRITSDTILRGPTTGQFWAVARNVPGVAHLLGVCHACQAPASTDDRECSRCGAAFPRPTDRNGLGLAPDDPALPQEGTQATAGEGERRNPPRSARAAVLETTTTSPRDEERREGRAAARASAENTAAGEVDAESEEDTPGSSSWMIWLLVGLNLLLALAIILALMFRDAFTFG